LFALNLKHRESDGSGESPVLKTRRPISHGQRGQHFYAVNTDSLLSAKC